MVETFGEMSDEEKDRLYLQTLGRKKSKQSLIKKKSKNDRIQYDESKTLTELKSYIDQTYDEHYSQNNFQSAEFIIDGGHGEGFLYR